MRIACAGGESRPSARPAVGREVHGIGPEAA